MKLSIIIPVYNEEKTISIVLDKVLKLELPRITKEIIVVDDGSTDSTFSMIKDHPSISLRTRGSTPIKSESKIKILKHLKNKGKGAAVKTGIKNATGDYVIIQDADLEYDPKYIKDLIIPIEKGVAKVVYGTRLKRKPNLKGEEKTSQFLLHYLGNRFLSLVTSILYGQWITDMETCYKLFPRNAMLKIKLNARGFELEPEITSKLLKTGYKIYELPITAIPRGYSEGKKLNTFRDGFKAFWFLLKYRFTD